MIVIISYVMFHFACSSLNLHMVHPEDLFLLRLRRLDDIPISEMEKQRQVGQVNGDTKVNW